MSHTGTDKRHAGSKELKSRPFECLKDRLKKASAPGVKNIGPAVQEEKPGPNESVPSSDTDLFLKAMEGVKPLKGKKRRGHTPGSTTPGNAGNRKEKELEDAVRELKDLVEGKMPLPVEKIPEYMDGPPVNSDRRLLKKLRSGDFAIQAYCELHGLNADQALKVCDGFMSDSLMSNRRCIAYIHGRGKSSPGKPVLKELVKNFLNRGRFRRYILAYCSAPSWDGGPGVTYVLLRKRPVKKSRKR